MHTKLGTLIDVFVSGCGKPKTVICVDTEMTDPEFFIHLPQDDGKSLNACVSETEIEKLHKGSSLDKLVTEYLQRKKHGD